MSALYDQIKKLTRTERLDLVQENWDGVAAEADVFDISAAQAVELDRRLAQHQAQPDEGGGLDTLAARLGVRL